MAAKVWLIHCLINITKMSSLLIPSIKQLPFGGAVIRNSDFCVVSLEHKLYHKHGNFIHMVTQVRLSHPLALHSLHKVDNSKILPVSKCLQCVTLQVLSPRHIFVCVCCSIQTSVLVQLWRRMWWRLPPCWNMKASKCKNLEQYALWVNLEVHRCCILNI